MEVIKHWHGLLREVGIPHPWKFSGLSRVGWGLSYLT